MGGKKRAKQFFQKHTNSAFNKCWQKNRWKKVRKSGSYIRTNIVPKKWGVKNARINFSRNTRIVRPKNLAKKSSEKGAKKRFLFSTNSVIKTGGKKRRNQFSRNTRIVQPKKLGKKSSEKSAKSVFYIRTITVTKIWGEKTRQTIFPKNTTIVRPKNVREKIFGKKCEKAFFLFARMSYQKKRGEKRAKQLFQKHTYSATKKVV